MATQLSGNIFLTSANILQCMGSPLPGTCWQYYYGDSLDLDVPTYYHQDEWVGHLLILFAGTSAATTPLLQAATPTLPPLLPLLKQWQQRWQHSIAASGGGAVAAMVAVGQQYCFASGCCHSPTTGCYVLLLPLLPLLKQWRQQQKQQQTSWCGILQWGCSSSSSSSVATTLLRRLLLPPPQLVTAPCCRHCCHYSSSGKAAVELA